MAKNGKVARIRRWDYSGLPDDVEELRTIAKRLEARETRLEMDLAIRECPAIEEAVLRVMLAYNDVKVGEETLRSIQVLSGGDGEIRMASVKRCADLRREIQEMKEGRSSRPSGMLPVLEARLDALWSSVSSDRYAMELDGVRLKLSRAEEALRDEMVRASPLLEQFGLSAEDFFPRAARRVAETAVGG